MAANRAFGSQHLRGLLIRVLVCLVLGIAGFSAVLALAKLRVSQEPLVDFGVRVRTRGEPESEAVGGEKRLRFAVASMISAEGTFSSYRELVQRVCRDVDLPEAFIVRPSYADVRRGLEEKTIDVAFVCTGTYAFSAAKKKIKPLVQPEFQNGLQYRCLLIVPMSSRAKTIEDLRGATMAFTDPESNTGYLVPSAMLADRGEDPRSFFKSIVFTGSHDRSIRAVALEAVDVAGVDSLVWASLVQRDPSLARSVRILWQSDPFGPPLIVVPQGLDNSLEASLRAAFLNLDEDEDGRRILLSIGIKRFVAARPEAYQTAISLYQRLERKGVLSWP